MDRETADESLDIGANFAIVFRFDLAVSREVIGDFFADGFGEGNGWRLGLDLINPPGTGDYEEEQDREDDLLQRAAIPGLAECGLAECGLAECGEVAP